MMRVLIAVLLAACGGDSSKTRVEPAPAVVDAGAPKTRACFCFSWVHLDENGENCYETKPNCDAEFKGFGRNMKIECRAEQRTRCGGHACRNIGKECAQLY